MDIAEPLETDPAEVDEPDAADAVRLSAAERAIFEAMYRRHADEVTRLLRRRLAHDDDVADLVQEAFLRILRYRHFGLDSLRYLLIRTALNLAASYYVPAYRRFPHVPIDGLEISQVAPSLDDRLDEQQQLAHLRAAIHGLPPRCREVLLLRLNGGLRQREIAERCGISARMVEQHLARAQLLIRKRVGTLAAQEATLRTT